ncbi:HipA N-terminal domain-containing protein [Seleniivibrio sp.]|uniref:HipA N-terminal domain-containing protein n=1 Tax=Seleniivibrio sp. TaxID=2898801 RepID=UPI0026013EC9|nr:HipA N-terminal domain-containing protein [Seleniivibrio sp.]MCD8554739.1 HipA N-terminal domain-containing protein [Seleniivibrio sp.]
MRKAIIFQQGRPAGYLAETEHGYEFLYLPDYSGSAISLTMPVSDVPYIFNDFPPFFDGLLPEGYQLESLLRRLKIDRTDSFSQLIAVGADLVGSVTVEEVTE